MRIIKAAIALVALATSTEAIDILAASYCGMDEVDVWSMGIITHSTEMQNWYRRSNESMTSHQCISWGSESPGRIEETSLA